MKYGNGIRSRNKAFALSVVVTVTLILTLLGVSMLSLGASAQIRANKVRNDIAARTAADAGLTLAIYEMNRKLMTETTWDNDKLPLASGVILPSSNTEYSYEVKGDPASGFQITATGVSGRTTRKVYSTIRLKSGFESAVTAKNAMLFYSGSTVDGFNSDTGETGLTANVGTNNTKSGSVVLMSGAQINGDVLIGMGGDPGNVVKGSGDINGEVYDMSSEVYFPPVTSPGYTNPPQKLQVNNKTVTINAKDSGLYSSIDISGGGKKPGLLRVNGDVVLEVTGDIDIASDCSIEISAGGSLTIYVAGDFISKNDADINNKGVASNFRVYGTGTTGQKIELKAKGDLVGVIYAPEADIDIKAGGDIYGSVVGNNYITKSKSNFHYDHALAETVTIGDPGTYFVVESWTEDG